jgi:dienelactone hydrolase
MSSSVPGRETVRFSAGEGSCAGWLYLPADRAMPAPAVVLGHGLGAVKEMGLAAYAERFAAHGYVCLVFDYRHFGDSDGEPRQLLDVNRQLADWASAIAFARSLPQVDPDRVALFGSSFGGGHVIEVASRDRRIAAVVAQCPFTSGSASARTIDAIGLAKVTALAVRDEIARLRGKPPVLVALAGAPRSAALMNAPDALPGYLGLIPPGTPFTNAVAARVGLRIPLRHPGRAAKRVACPILFCICDRDSVAPAHPTARYARQAPRSEVIHYPIGHFDIYTGDAFEAAIADQLEFLGRHLG